MVGPFDTVSYAAIRDGEWINMAINEVSKTYGVTVSVDAEGKSLFKFGANDLVGTSQATLMTLPAGVLSETYVSTNIITHVSSANAGDDQVIGIHGMTVSGGDFTEIDETVTLNGQTKVALPTPLARVTRAYNTGTTNLAGNVYVFEDDTLTAGVPDTDAKVHLIVVAAENQSLKASTVIASIDYAFLTNINASIEEKNAAGAVIRVKVRTQGSVFRTIFRRGLNSLGAELNIDIRPFLIIPPNADILVTAEADGSSTPISGGFDMIMARIQT